jgi:HprK-related kinase A
VHLPFGYRRLPSHHRGRHHTATPRQSRRPAPEALDMKLSDWSRPELAERLRGHGIFLHSGPFLSRIRTAEPAVVDGLALLYADHRVSAEEPYADFHIALRRPRSLRRWIAPQVQFEYDGLLPFKPLPLSQALPMLEWGLNWCVSTHAHHFLLVHSAAVEKNGLAAILPGAPGSGKSTLTAYMVHNGWRLLSDELALISLRTGQLTALARPISLKNRSIDVIADALPDAVISARCQHTAKGTVALLKAPKTSVDRAAEPARAAWVIFPTFKFTTATTLTRRPKADTLMELGRNAFNYSVHGQLGFEVLSRLVDDCACYNLTYSALPEAMAAIDSLGQQAARPIGVQA